jgi:hypothetical protein
MILASDSFGNVYAIPDRDGLSSVMAARSDQGARMAQSGTLLRWFRAAESRERAGAPVAHAARHAQFFLASYPCRISFAQRVWGSSPRRGGASARARVRPGRKRRCQCRFRSVPGRFLSNVAMVLRRACRNLLLSERFPLQPSCKLLRSRRWGLHGWTGLLVGRRRSSDPARCRAMRTG